MAVTEIYLICYVTVAVKKYKIPAPIEWARSSCKTVFANAIKNSTLNLKTSQFIAYNTFLRPNLESKIIIFRFYRLYYEKFGSACQRNPNPRKWNGFLFFK